MRKRTAFSIFVFVILMISVSVCYAQIPRQYYGVWDRNDDYSVEEYPFLKGLTYNEKWQDVETSAGAFDWSPLDTAFARAYASGQALYAKINVGPDSPDWLYDNGVPRVSADGDSYPYYLDEDYKTYCFRMVHAFADHIREQPDHLLEKIAFVQVQTGSTGDEAPYKGTPSPSSYAISDAEWCAFRLEMFAVFDTAFQEGSGRKIPLLFNCVGDEYVEEWNWVVANITAGLGRKGSAYVRGHHLTEERTFAELWRPYLVDPQGVRLFSRAEMDQTWTKPYYSLNVPLNFYWGAINGLHSGLSVWDITSSAMDGIATHGYENCFYFFNKYAGEIYADSARAAFCALHRGLDASDTDTYPEAVYGDASKGNEDRYTAICADFSQYGAKMDHVYAATRGQVYQRSSQTGFNDAGWEIFSGNYGRWLTQVDPEETSVALWRVGGTITTSSPIYSRFARGFEHSSGKDTMFFDIDDRFFSLGNTAVNVKIIYYDTPGSWELQYDAADNAAKTAMSVTNTNTETWKSDSILIEDGNFNNRCPRSCDLMLVNTGGEDNIFHMIEITKEGTTPIRESSYHQKPQIQTVIRCSPNPFSGQTAMRFQLSGWTDAKLSIYDAQGRLIKTLINEKRGAGSHRVQWNGRDANGKRLSAGMYFVRFQAGDRTDTRPIILLK